MTARNFLHHEPRPAFDAEDLRQRAELHRADDDHSIADLLETIANIVARADL